MAEIKAQGVNLEGIEDVFRICGWQSGMAVLDRRIADFVRGTDQRIQSFLREMEKYDRERLQGSPGSENNSERVVEKPVIKRGRPKKTAERIGQTFTYRAKRGETNMRLQKFFQALKQLGWIASDTQQRDFIDLFSGDQKEIHPAARWLQHLGDGERPLLEQGGQQGVRQRPPALHDPTRGQDADHPVAGAPDESESGLGAAVQGDDGLAKNGARSAVCLRSC